MLGFRSYI